MALEALPWRVLRPSGQSLFLRVHIWLRLRTLDHPKPSFVNHLRSLATDISQRNMSLKTTKLDTFFPLPSEAPSSQSPVRLPGITRESSEALVKVLKDDHVKWHAFFNDKGFHKCVVRSCCCIIQCRLTLPDSHASHHLVAIYAMGARGELIEQAYQTHIVYMRPAFKSPEPITDENFWKHLGKREYVGN